MCLGFGVSKKTTTFALSIETMTHGVMVTQQFLVLPFLVRIRVAQRRGDHFMVASFFCYLLFSDQCKSGIKMKSRLEIKIRVNVKLSKTAPSD